MSAWSRIANVFRSGRVNRDIDEELQSHIDEALAAGRDPNELSKAFGSRLRAREAARDAVIATWLESLIADAIFGCRQILKHKTASAAAVLSLALGIGSCMAAFQLIDALFLRPLPVAHPEQLYELTYPNLFEGKIETLDRFNYPAFRLLRASVKDQADLIAISVPLRIDVTFGPDQDIERVWRQYVSGSMFEEFGLKPALGRLFTARDDATAGADPYAVISYDYWARRFGKDPAVIGRRFRNADKLLEVIGVAPKGFTGTDPGTFTDIFVPNSMNDLAIYRTWGAYRTWLRLKPGANRTEIQGRFTAAVHVDREEDVKTWSPVRSEQDRDFYLEAPVSLEPVAAGKSNEQHGYQRPLTIFSVLVGLVLLIACINVANLMTAQAAARAREMAMRVSIGAGRARLVQLVLIESALIAFGASVLGLTFSWWAPPILVTKLNPPDQPMRLAFDAHWQVTFFAVVLTFAVTLLFGLAPALRASSVKPGLTSKGGDDPHRSHRYMTISIGAQVAFCSFVLFIAGLFISTFDRMANQPTGFTAARVLTVESATKTNLPAESWYQVTEQLSPLPGVQSAALAEYALMSFNAQTRFIWADGHVPDGTWSHSTWFLGVSPGWFKTMQLRILAGRDFRWDDGYPKVAIVNEKFAQRYFGVENPVGRSFETEFSMTQPNPRLTMQVIGVVSNARYEDMRLPIPATAYVPFRGVTALVERNRNRATFLIRTESSDPLALAPTVRRAIRAIQPEIRVANVVTQSDLVQSQMVRERLLAMLSLFFAALALILAAVGVYGVLNYAVVERNREIGIRIALGATSINITQHVTTGAVATIAIGSIVGVGLGLVSEPYIAALLYHVKANDPVMLASPLITLLCAAVLAAVPPVIRAVRIDPAVLLRSE